MTYFFLKEKVSKKNFTACFFELDFLRWKGAAPYETI